MGRERFEQWKDEETDFTRGTTLKFNGARQEELNEKQKEAGKVVVVARSRS